MERIQDGRRTRPGVALRALLALRSVAMLGGLMAGATGATGAWAQTAAAPDRAGEDTLKCLVQPATPLAYPEQGDDGNGFVRIALTFTAPDRAPEVKFLAQFGRAVFAEAAAERARSYRLPCMTPGQAAISAVQTFRFRPGADASAATVGDTQLVRDTAKGELALRCLRAPPARFDPRAAGPDPVAIGSAYLELSFTGGEKPPEVKVLHNSLPKGLFADYSTWAHKMRMPCASESSTPVVLTHRYLFVNGTPKLQLKPMTLRQFVDLLKDDEVTRSADFNLDSMSCPFTVRVMPWQPKVANVITELGPRRPDRTEFLRWLERVRLDVDETTWERLAGYEFDVQVPCGSLNLTPQRADGQGQAS